MDRKVESQAESLYRLVDGTTATPGECHENDAGVLVSSGGVPVALDSAGNPQTLGGEQDAQAAANVTGVKTDVESTGAAAAAMSPEAEEDKAARESAADRRRAAEEKER